MRIPTVVIVNDDNDQLKELAGKLKSMVRIYYRNSLQGEQLYAIREGVIYFDDKGDKQIVHQDIYTETFKQIEIKLATTSALSKKLLENHLARQNKQ